MIAPRASTSLTMPLTIVPLGFSAMKAENGSFELLDAERDALALRIDRQHHGLDLLALLVVAHGFFARLVPGDVGQVHQAVDAARQADEDAEVGDRLDLAARPCRPLVVLGELLPRVRLALLHAERDAAALLVDVEHHDFDFVAERARPWPD